MFFFLACAAREPAPDRDFDGYPQGVDCDDENIEVTVPVTRYRDADGDGFGDPAVSGLACVNDPDWSGIPTDCDDTDPAVHPDAEERCNGVDDNCDETVDVDAVDRVALYTDADGDGFGDPETRTTDCPRDGNSADGTDCDDTDPSVHPAADEHCDGLDEDCDGVVDDNSVSGWLIWADEDGDGFGGGEEIISCDPPGDAAYVGGDCDDADDSVNPDGWESCNDVDDDCDGTVDDGVGTTMFADADGDGEGDAATAEVHCDGTPGWVRTANDCDDTDATVSPDAEEICDGADNDCNSMVDDNAADATVWFTDEDGDGVGYAMAYVCTPPANGVETPGDCDDTDPSTTACPDVCDTLVSYTGSVRFAGITSASDIEEFCDEFNAIDGSVFISETYAADLSALHCLCAVSGSVIVYQDDTLRRLTGMEQFTEVAGLSIGDVPLLRDMSGLEQLTSITGTLEISGNVDALASLAGLDSLTTVGSLDIRYAALPSLAGLDSLTTVTGDLPLDGSVPPNLEGLESLTSIGGALTIDMESLTSLAPLAQLTSVHHLWIEETGDLTDLSELSSLTRISGSLTLYRSGLQRLDGLEAVTHLDSIDITGSEELVSIEGLSGLSTVAGDLSITGCNGLTDLSGLESLTTVDGSFTISANDGMTSLNGPSQLSSVGGLTVEYSDSLRTLEGLDALETSDVVRVRYNDALVSLAGLGALTEVNGLLEVQGNAVNSYEGLDALERVAADLTFGLGTYPESGAGLDALTTIDGDLMVVDVAASPELPALTSVGGRVLLENSALNPAGWPSLTTIGGDLYLSYATVPEDLEGFSALRSVGGLWLISAYGLVRLDGLEGLSEIPGDLYMHVNSELVDVSALYGLASVGGDFTLTDNALTLESAEALRDTIGLSNLYGTVTIRE